MQTRKAKTAIRRTAVRETGVSRHHGGPIEGPPETPRTSQHYHIEGINYLKGNGNTSFLSVGSLSSSPHFFRMDLSSTHSFSDRSPV